MKYAVVTGATQGIGKAIAEKLLSEGFSIAICARSQSDLEQLEQSWKQEYPGAQVLCLSADFSKQEDVKGFAKKVMDAFPHIDILVNNAGIFFPGNITEEKEGDLETIMQVNVFSAYHLTRILMPAIRNNSGAHIFNMCSIASLRAYPNGGSYSISKYALLGFSENLRMELLPRRIKVTAICPGATESRSWAGAEIPKGRIMEASDIASMVWSAYNLSPQANTEIIVLRPLDGDM